MKDNLSSLPMVFVISFQTCKENLALEMGLS